MIRCSWVHPSRLSFLSPSSEITTPVVLEVGPSRSLRFRLVSASRLPILALGYREEDLRPHPDDTYWCTEVEWGSDARAAELWEASSPSPEPPAVPGRGAHLLKEPPGEEELEALGWALVTTQEPGKAPTRELVVHPEGGREKLKEYLDDQPPDDVNELYLRVLQIAVRDINDAAASSPRSSRAVGVVLPWVFEGSQVHVERVSMACHFHLARAQAESVFATLSPFSLQVFSHTALHSTSTVLRDVANAHTRWRFVQPERSPREPWARAASTNLRSLQQSRDLFSAFESPAFALCKEEDPVRAVLSESTALVVLEERDPYTEKARRLAAGAPVREIPLHAYR